MSAMVNVWTGDALADGVDVVSGASLPNGVAVPGNFTGSGATWARGFSGTAVLRTWGHGVETLGADTDTARIDATLTTPQSGVRTQMKVTRGPFTTTNLLPLAVRTGAAQLALLTMSPDTAPYVTLQAPLGTFLAGSQTPNVGVGDVLLIDLVAALHSAPTTSNGRIFYRVKNLTNPTWNTTGEFFYDSGYTKNLGTVNPSVVRFAKTAGGVMSGTSTKFEYLGADPITVLTTDTSEAAAKAYFADAPITSAPLADPTVTINSVSHPTSTGATNGTITVSWNPITNADHYEVGYTTGDASAPPVTIATTSATSPYTITGLAAGLYSVFVRAMPA